MDSWTALVWSVWKRAFFPFLSERTLRFSHCLLPYIMSSCTGKEEKTVKSREFLWNLHRHTCNDVCRKWAEYVSKNTNGADNSNVKTNQVIDVSNVSSWRCSHRLLLLLLGNQKLQQQQQTINKALHHKTIVFKVSLENSQSSVHWQIQYILHRKALRWEPSLFFLFNWVIKESQFLPEVTTLHCDTNTKIILKNNNFTCSTPSPITPHPTVWSDWWLHMIWRHVTFTVASFSIPFQLL